MTVSAPLQNTLIFPSGHRTIVDIRLRVELNSQTFKTSYSYEVPCMLINTDLGFRVYENERHQRGYDVELQDARTWN